MEINKTILNTVFEDETSSEQNTSNNLFIEITYFSDNIPSIKSYYNMTQPDYRDLKTLTMDLYIDDFIDGENLTTDKLDIHIINNPNNIKLCKDFLKIFGNPFDIVNLINEKKQLSPNIKLSSKQILEDSFSDASNNDNSFYKNNVLNSDSDSEDYINTMTEIISTFNKTKNVDKEKIKKLAEVNPDSLLDNIIDEICKTNKS